MILGNLLDVSQICCTWTNKKSKCKVKKIHSYKKGSLLKFSTLTGKKFLSQKSVPPFFFSWAKKGGPHTHEKKNMCPPPSWATFCTHTQKNAQNVPLLSGPANGGKRVVIGSCTNFQSLKNLRSYIVTET